MDRKSQVKDFTSRQYSPEAFSLLCGFAQSFPLFSNFVFSFLFFFSQQQTANHGYGTIGIWQETRKVC